MASYYLAVDVGTHAVRVGLCSKGVVHELVARKVELLRDTSSSHEGLFTGASATALSIVEQDAKAILQAVQACLFEIQHKLTKDTCLIGAGLAVQRSSVLAWDRQSGEALSPLLSWQDTRAGNVITRLRPLQKKQIRTVTGLVPSAYLGASKLAYLLERFQSVDGKSNIDLMVGPLSTWLSHHLCDARAGHWLCDESIAARMMLYGIEQRQWDEKLCEMFSVPIHFLPTLAPSLSHFGDIALSNNSHIHSVPLSLVCGDQNSAFNALMHSQINTHPVHDQRTIVNLGSGAFVLSPAVANVARVEGLQTTLVHSTAGEQLCVLEGTVNGAGTAIKYYIDTYKYFTDESSYFSELDSLCERWDGSTLFFNSVGGFGAPWWKSQFCAEDSQFYSSIGERLTLKSLSPQESAMAVVESIVFLLTTILCAMPQSDLLVLAGGLSRCDMLVERLATLNRCKIFVSEECEMTLLGIGNLLGQNTIATPLNGRIISPAQGKKYRCLSRRYESYLTLMHKRMERVEA